MLYFLLVNLSKNLDKIYNLYIIMYMMTKTIDTTDNKRVPAVITEEARDALQELAELLKEEKGVRSMSLFEAASIAIVETADRKARAKARRLARMAELRNTRRTNRAGVTAAQ